jgi:hypothetical protein
LISRSRNLTDTIASLATWPAPNSRQKHCGRIVAGINEK